MSADSSLVGARIRRESVRITECGVGTVVSYFIPKAYIALSCHTQHFGLVDDNSTTQPYKLPEGA